MHNERPGARAHHRDRGENGREEGEVLSPTEAASRERGRALKRYVRAAGALQGLYDDKALAHAAEVQRGAVAGWWRGSRPTPETLKRLADALRLSYEELSEFVYFDGPPPQIEPVGLDAIREGVQRGRQRLAEPAHSTLPPSPRRPSRGNGEGPGRRPEQ